MHGTQKTIATANRPADAVAAATAALQASAAETLRTTAWPTPRLESWRYTNVRAVERALRGDDGEAAEPKATDAAAALDWPFEVDAGLHSVDGAGLVGAAIVGVRVVAFADAVGLDAERIAASLGVVARVDGAEFAVSARNGAGFEGGTLIVIEGEVAAPVMVDLFARSGAASLPRTLIVATQNARATVIEHHRGSANAVALPVAEIVLEQGSSLEHVVVQDFDISGYDLATMAVNVGRDAHYGAVVFQFGAAIGRVDLRVALRGNGASCRLDGLYMAGGNQHLDMHIEVDHIGEHTTSSQRFKGLLDGHAAGVFRGNVRIARAARFADAAQLNRALLLSDNARAHAKPQLEIDNEDVKASHGATVGQLNADQLFYLQARGIAPALARQMLVAAFAVEIVDLLPPLAAATPLRGVLEHRVGVLRHQESAS